MQGSSGDGDGGLEEFFERDAAVAELHELLTGFFDQEKSDENEEAADPCKSSEEANEILASFEKSKKVFFAEVTACADKLESFIPLCRKFNMGCSDVLLAINDITEDLKTKQEENLDLSMINVNYGTGQKIDELEVGDSI